MVRWGYMIAGVELIINKNFAQNDFETKSGNTCEKATKNTKI